MDLSARLAVIHQPVRLRIMGLLYRRRDVAFARVRDLLALTDGNLASHAARLTEAGFLEARRALTREGFEVRYRITAAGSEAFHEYLGVLRGFLEGVEGARLEAEAGVPGSPAPPAPAGDP